MFWSALAEAQRLEAEEKVNTLVKCVVLHKQLSDHVCLDAGRPVAKLKFDNEQWASTFNPAPFKHRISLLFIFKFYSNIILFILLGGAGRRC